MHVRRSSAELVWSAFFDMSFDKVDLKNVGLQPFDFAPQCIHPHSLLDWPEFDLFHTVLEPANQFLRTNPGLTVVSCESVHLRVEKDHIREPDRSDYFQTGEILRPFVKGLRIWVKSRESFQTNVPDEIDYVSFVPKFGDDARATKSPVEILSEMNVWIHEHPIQGRITNLETLQMRGVEGLINVDMTTWNQQNSPSRLKQSILKFFRVFFVVDDSHPEEGMGFMDFFPESLEGVGIFSWPVVERFGDVISRANEWITLLPENVRVLSFQTILCRSDYKSSTDAYRTYYWDEYFHMYHKRFIRIAYATRTRSGRTTLQAPRSISAKLFAPGVIRDPNWYKWSGAYETQSMVKARLNEWIYRTQAKVLGVETLSYKSCTGAEMSEGFAAMHTWNEKGRHGPKQEQYVICLRVYVEGTPEDPEDFVLPKTLVDWKVNHGGHCCHPM